MFHGVFPPRPAAGDKVPAPGSAAAGRSGTRGDPAECFIQPPLALRGRGAAAALLQLERVHAGVPGGQMALPGLARIVRARSFRGAEAGLGYLGEFRVLPGLPP